MCVCGSNDCSNINIRRVFVLKFCCTLYTDYAFALCRRYTHFNATLYKAYRVSAPLLRLRVCRCSSRDAQCHSYDRQRTRSCHWPNRMRHWAQGENLEAPRLCPTFEGQQSGANTYQGEKCIQGWPSTRALSVRRWAKISRKVHSAAAMSSPFLLSGLLAMHTLTKAISFWKARARWINAYIRARYCRRHTSVFTLYTKRVKSQAAPISVIWHTHTHTQTMRL